jgi:hypothetical protein
MSKVQGHMSAAFSFERSVRAHLHQRRWVRLHVFLIGTLTFGLLWGLSHSMMAAGVDSMAVRYGVALLLTYPAYLGLLWLWCHWLLSREDAGPDSCDPGFDLPELSPDGSAEMPVFRPGGGGDFGGGGASGSFDASGEAISGAADAGASSLGKMASVTADAVGGADDGAVVRVPVAVAIGIAVALGTVLGFTVFGLFGVEIVLGVAVEIAFASAGGALALKAQREDWLQHAVRRTLAPMAIVLAATVAVGLAIAHWLPQANTLPQALRLLFG